MAEPQPAADLEGFLAACTRAWNTGDLDGIVDAYATLCFVVKDGQVLRHRDDVAKRRYFGESLAGNRSQGPHTWSVGELDASAGVELRR
jgi:hypothetical protein